ncbi:MAG: hypothetical protein ACREIP_09215, partial [Alphaproteobacteria bacterium]
WEGCIGAGGLLPPRRPGKPIVICATVARAQVLAAFTEGGDAEIVLAPPVAATLETDDQAVVAKLARRAGPLGMRG